MYSREEKLKVSAAKPGECLDGLRSLLCAVHSYGPGLLSVQDFHRSPKCRLLLNRTHVSERPVLDLACGRREGAGLYRAGMDVEPCESGSIVHSGAPSMNAARPPSVWAPLLSA